jgi:FdrA protein
MRVSDAVGALPGVNAAIVAMGTPVNLELLADLDGAAAELDAGPNDLVIALDVADGDSLAAALALLESALDGQASAGPGPAPRTGARGMASGGAGMAGVVPRTVGGAVRRSGAGLALVSTPGRYAFVEAMDALDAGAHVMLFSDNMPLEQEVLLKRVAARRGLLVMGPDCGTTVISGVGLGFANVVRPGPVGLVAASGTGAQQIMSLLAWAGVGVSHCLGVGGRDLTDAVGAASTLAALEVLDADTGTDIIVVVGKPPAPRVAAALREHAARLATPVEFALVEPDGPDLTAATERVLARLDRPAPDPWPRWLPEPPTPPAPPTTTPVAGATPAVRGLFCGGTLREESAAIAARGFAAYQVDLIDLGDDAYTQGRAHPMLDPTVRLARVAAAAADPDCRVLLLDLVLGHGAHPDPAAGLAAAVRSALAARPDGDLAVVVSLVATPDDPQGTVDQARAMAGAGAAVFVSNAEATRHALGLAGGGR